MAIDPVLLWFIIGLVLTLLEFFVPGVILVFFGAGAWVVSIATYLGLTISFESQLLLFAVASVLLIVSLRKWIKGKFYGYVTGVQDPEKNLDEFTGKIVTVLEDIVPGRQDGRVELKGAAWNAVSDEHINKGDVVVITGVDGITLRVTKKKEN